MSSPAYHLAQVNIARARGEMDSLEMADFAELLDPVPSKVLERLRRDER